MVVWGGGGVVTGSGCRSGFVEEAKVYSLGVEEVGEEGVVVAADGVLNGRVVVLLWWLVGAGALRVWKCRVGHDYDDGRVEVEEVWRVTCQQLICNTDSVWW